MFRLEKKNEREIFELHDNNPWVSVEANGDVIVKKKWNADKLGEDKNIEFCVAVGKQGHNGKFFFLDFHLYGVKLLKKS